MLRTLYKIVAAGFGSYITYENVMSSDISLAHAKKYNVFTPRYRSHMTFTETIMENGGLTAFERGVIPVLKGVWYAGLMPYFLPAFTYDKYNENHVRHLCSGAGSYSEFERVYRQRHGMKPLN